MNPPERNAYFYFALAALGWSIEPVVIKLLVPSLSVFTINLFISIFASTGLGFFVLLFKKYKYLRFYSGKDYFFLGVLSLFGMIAYNLLFVYCFNFLPVSEANTLNYLWPVFIGVLAVPVLGEKISTKNALALLLGFFGVWVMMTEGRLGAISPSKLFPIFIAILAAFSWAVFNVLQKKYKYEPTSSMFIMSLYSVPFFTLLAFFTNSFILPNRFELLGLSYLGFIAYGAAIVVYVKALRYGKTKNIASLSFVTPFVSLLWAFLILSERIDLFHLLGLALIILGALVQTRKESSSVPEITQNRSFDVTKVFLETNNLQIYQALKTGGTVMAIPVKSSVKLESELTRLQNQSELTALLTDIPLRNELSFDEILTVREQTRARSDQTVVIAAGDPEETSKLLSLIMQY